MNCPVCRVEVVARHNRCPWCDHVFPAVTSPFVADVLQEAFAFTALFHAYPHPAKIRSAA